MKLKPNPKLSGKRNRKHEKRKRKLTKRRLRFLSNPSIRQLNISLVAPSSFNFLENIQENIRFFKKLETAIRQCQRITIDLRKVVQIHPSSCLILRYWELVAKRKGISFQGYLPLKINIKEKFFESGYFKLIDHKGKPDWNNIISFSSAQSMHLTSKLKIDGEAATQIINAAIASVWECNGRCRGLRTVLLELMLNTFEHASGSDKGKVRWMLAINKLENRDGVSFCFFDMGVGIIKSLEQKNALQEIKGNSNRWYRFLDEFFNLIGATTKRTYVPLFESIFFERKSISSTKMGYRGKGLPGLAEQALDLNAISNLMLISNQIVVDLSNRKIFEVNSDFSGTFVYFELLKSNHFIQD